ncbi:MAG: amidohydrolase family protein [Chloroflexota bacterium]
MSHLWATSAGKEETPGRYSLLLQGGEVIDPASGLRGRFDVAFSGDAVAAIADHIDPQLAARVEKVGGLLVVPGLVDIHVHVFEGVGESTSADTDCLGRGSTTVVDGGSAGANTFELFLRVAAQSSTRVLAWLNLSTIGQADTRVGELIALAHADVDAAVAMARAHPDTIVGLKARLSTYAAGGTCKPVLRLLREAADETGLPVMVHVGDTGEPLAEIFPFLRPGDVVSHILTGRKFGILRTDGRIIPEAYEARDRGVLFDSARGRNHVAFPVLQAAVEQGLLPDSLSSDITRFAAVDPEFSQVMMGTQLLAFGVPLEEVVARMTLLPARVIRRDDLGRLQVGGIGDATLLRLEEGDFAIQDVDGRVRQTTLRLTAAGVVRGGSYAPIPGRR